jgi:anti-sigma factor RsiW
MSASSPTHRQTWDLIPWIVNDTATPDERAAAEAHLAACQQCREEITFQRQVRAAMLSQPSAEGSDGWQRLRARLDESGDEQGKQLQEAQVISAPARARRGIREFGWMAACLLEAVALGALGMALWSRGQAPHPAALPSTYQTLATPQPVAPNATLRIVMEPHTTLAQLETLLQQSGLQIVAGPSAEGVWSLAPSGESGHTATEAALRSLRANPLVRFAEPLGSP